MVMRTTAGAQTAESVDDLTGWLRALRAPFTVTETVLLACDGHGDTRPTWTYVEADPRAGVARRRCLSCATSVNVLDSRDRWSWPAMWSCQGCGQSIAELVAGLACTDDDHVDWVALAARCVECGRVGGVTDLLVPHRPVTEVIAAL